MRQRIHTGCKCTQCTAGKNKKGTIMFKEKDTNLVSEGDSSEWRSSKVE
jgi:hypothetical protein